MRSDCEPVRGDYEPVSETACVRMRGRSGGGGKNRKREKEAEILGLVSEKQGAKRQCFAIK